MSEVGVGGGSARRKGRKRKKRMKAANGFKARKGGCLFSFFQG
jgi:hypothetical protein